MDTPSRMECLQETRVETLNFIKDWLMGPPGSQNLLWLYGIAGCGKTTIANTIASYFRDLGRLGWLKMFIFILYLSFPGAFLSFDRSAKSDPSLVVRTLAYQLGAYDTRIGAAVSSAIGNNPRIHESPLNLQFSKLLVEPLSSLEHLPTQGPIIIVFDSLDECGDQRSRKKLLGLFAEDLKKLPPFVRIFATSRPQLDISVAFKGQSNIVSLEFQIDNDANRRDIKLYLRVQLEEIREKDDHLASSPDWPGKGTIDKLAEQSAGLFIWCSNALTFIEKGTDPEERLDMLLQAEFRKKAESALDDLYVLALDTSGLWEDETFGSDFRAILGAIIVAKEPLIHQTIDDILALPAHRPSSHTIHRFGCVLHWLSPEPVRILHPSFADFLSDRGRCKREMWFVDVPLHTRNLVSKCFRIMQAELKFNICRLETSDIRNEDVPDLDGRVKAAILPHLSYACRFWGDHLEATPQQDPDAEAIREALRTFFTSRLLYWLEALSLLKSVAVAPSAVLSAANWTTVRGIFLYPEIRIDHKFSGFR
jgi:hypothetical protein